MPSAAKSAPFAKNAPFAKTDVAAHWAERGEDWDRWADTLAEMAQRFNQPLLDAAELAEGNCLLDLASGAGEPALTAARRVGAQGRVVATDLVPEMLAGTRRRAQEAGLDHLHCHLADMEALPFDDASFDGATCRFGIMFVPDVARALAEIRRVLKPGARAALMVWGPLAENTLFQVLRESADSILGARDTGQEDAIFRFAESGRLAAALAESGFADIRETSLAPTGKARLSARFWRPNLDMSFGAALARAEPERRAALDAEIERRFAALAEDGICRLSVLVRVVSGRKA